MTGDDPTDVVHDHEDLQSGHPHLAVFGANGSRQPVVSGTQRAAFFAYSDNYLIDTDHGIIMDVEATRSVRQAEVGSTLTMLDRTAERFDIRPDWLAADKAYGSEESLVEIVLKRQILPFIPVIDKGERTDGTLSRSDFT